jgi:hypothetical protein
VLRLLHPELRADNKMAEIVLKSTFSPELTQKGPKRGLPYPTHLRWVVHERKKEETCSFFFSDVPSF